ncbi:YlbE-like family protein [Anoxybacteroides tepidamans]|uniref:YlbE-like family protein n=1 Tax=Anoxybacteroides tepidamans TaxID=265948 RepID=UPI0004809A1A|nr:YlbE-like family protein [Anoxybacillus tepidamans]
MRKEVVQYIQSKKMLQMFIREKPRWYRILSRDPSKLASFELKALEYYEQTLPHKVEKVANSLEMASLMLHMFQAIRD